MEGKGISFIILLIIVALLSLTLAGLAFYVFISAGSSKTAADVSQKENIKVPQDDELDILELFEWKKYFNLKATDDKKISVIQVSAEIKYLKKVTGIKDVKKKVELNKKEIREIIGSYFQNMTLEEVKLPDAKEKAKKELIKKVNDLLNLGEKDKKDIIYTIVFDEWFYQ